MSFLCKFMKEHTISTEEILDVDGTLRILPGTLLCCQLLCQALIDHALDSNLVSAGTDESLTWTEESLGIVDQLLRQSNWEVEEIRKLPLDVSFRYHLSSYRVSPLESTPRDDAQQDNDDEAIQPVHTEAGCGCGPIGPSNLTVDSSTRQENVIFFSVCRYGSSSYYLKRMEVYASEEVWPPFVAISHVRKYGLGNGQDNKLPLCQLPALQSLANQLQLDVTANDTFFWIDTLCLPVPRELRKKAFLLQPVIFSRATQVLVVDPPISQWPYGSPEEAMIRIRYSAWKSRVWTLLEGFLTQHLVFLFSNGMVDLDRILRDFDELSGEESAYLPVLRRNSNPELDRLPAEAAEILRMMKPFTQSIMIWASEAKRTQTVPVKYRQVDQSVLYKQLRLGCLSSPKFRLLVERDEARDIPCVCQSLIDVYGNHDEERHDKDTAQVVTRLGEMCLLGQERMQILFK